MSNSEAIRLYRAKMKFKIGDKVACSWRMTNPIKFRKNVIGTIIEVSIPPYPYVVEYTENGLAKIIYLMEDEITPLIDPNDVMKELV